MKSLNLIAIFMILASRKMLPHFPVFLFYDDCIIFDLIFNFGCFTNQVEQE
jgi:hypothetical protein